MGSASGKVDSQPPQVSLSGASSFCPGCGESLNVTLNVSDATSGVSSWSLTLDGAPLTSGSSSTNQTVPVPSAGLSAGSHTLTLSASDIAGNVNSTNLTFTLLLPTPTPTFTPLPTSTPLPPPTSTHVSSGGGASQEDEPGSQSGSSQPQSTPTPGPSVTPGGEETILPTEDMGEEQASIIEDTDPEQVIGAGSGGGGAPLDGDMLSTLALLGGVAGGLGAMAVYTLGKKPGDPATSPVARNYLIPQEAPNLVEVEYPYVYQWTEIKPDMLVKTYMGSKIEKVLARAGFYMNSEPYADFITKTYPKNGSAAGEKEGTITKMVPYIAYEQIWIPPIYKGIVKDIYEYRPMEIIHEEMRWREITVDAGNIPSELVKEFFKQMDPHLEFWEMEQKFQDFKETLSRLSLVIHEDNTKIVEQYLSDGIEMMVCINSSAYFYPNQTAIDAGNSGGRTIPRDALVTWTGNSYQAESGNTYLEVKWNDHGKEKVGWVNAEFLILCPDDTLSEQVGKIEDSADKRAGDGYAAQYISTTLDINGEKVQIEGVGDPYFQNLCGLWAVAYIGGKTITDVITALFLREKACGNIQYVGEKRVPVPDHPEQPSMKVSIYRVAEGTLLYPAFHNMATGYTAIQAMAEIVYDVRTALVNEVLRVDGEFQFLPGLIREQLAQGKRLVMGVAVVSQVGSIDLSTSGSHGDHFVAVTDVFFDNDQWMVRWYDPWIDGMKQASFDDFSKAAYRFSGGGSYCGFFAD